MRRSLALILLTLAALILAMVPPFGAAAQRQQPSPARADGPVDVDPQLQAQIQANPASGYLIMFRERADLSPAYEMDWTARGDFVVQALQAVAARTQKSVRAYLDAQGADYEAFWIDNIIVVKRSDVRTFGGLQAFSEIASLRAEPETYLIEPESKTEGAGTTAEPLAAGSNIAHVAAPAVWALGVTGQGIVVANIDTGVRYTHEALVAQYRGNLGNGVFDHDYNWLGAAGGSPTPVDDHGHGTHVMGTMVGDDGGTNQIGMAPGASWIACDGCEGSGCPSASLLSCAQWVAAPYPVGSPEGADPSQRPHVVNNSWGDCGRSYNDWYQGAVDAWHAAGIYPVFANGNASNCGYPQPPGLNTVGNPARYGNVTGVGSTGNSNGLYAPHSNWGPTDNLDTVNPQPGWADLKPQVVAPGVSIRSSVPSSDSAYASAGWTGTSMSAPHVAGLIALVWQAAPCLVGEYAVTETLLEQTARPIPYDDLGSGARWPNYATGWGEIDALAAVTEARVLCGPTGTLAGTVTASGAGGLAGVEITASLDVTTTLRATTDAAGAYSIRFAPVGFYTVTASAFGYLPVSFTQVEVISGSVTTQDFTLAPAPSATVSGTVTDATTGWPLYARIAIDGTPGMSVWTHPVTGYYSVTLPQGAAYAFTVQPFVEGYLGKTRPIGPLVADGTEDFALDADPALCTAPGYSRDYIYFEDFEAGNGGYTVSGTPADHWQWGEPVTWPARCASGAKCWGTNLSGNYAASANVMLTSPVIDLSTTTAPLTARWAQAWHIESFAFDKALAEVSINGGPWQAMWEHSGATAQIDWRSLSYDLSAATGASAQFRFRLTSDSSVNYDGYYVDGVGIHVTGACTPAAGGLVVGHVRDGNTLEPLVGALVASEDSSARTAATPLDPMVEDGFYTIFAAEGVAPVTASMEGGYANQTFNVQVQDGATVAQDFYLAAGRLVPTPATLEATLEWGQAATLPLTLANLGEVAASYALSVTALAEDFEGAFAPSGWTVINNGGACVWRRNDAVERDNYAGGQGFSAAADSDACGSGTTMNTELRSPALDLSRATSAHLDFVASYRHLGTSSFRVRVSGDGGSTWDTRLTWISDMDPRGPGRPISLDLTPYVGSGAVIVSFHYVAPGWDWWAQVDQVRVYADAGPWLSLSPRGGSVDAGDGATIDVEIDTTALPAPGAYTAAILLQNDTPYGDGVVPVTLLATSPPAYGLLAGTVTGLGYCDADAVPLAHATVFIESSLGVTWTLQTDASGLYRQWLDEAHSPLTVTASYEAGYGAQQMGSVVVSSGLTTTQDFDLRLLAPCLSVAPGALHAELTPGNVGTRWLTVRNTGAAALSFELLEYDGGFHPAMAAPSISRDRRTGSTARLPVPDPQSPPAPSITPLADVIQDGGFELGTPNPYWDEYSLRFGTPVCDAASCGLGGGTAGPRSGAWWAWFGGSNSGDTGSIEQTILIDVGSSATLSFWVWVGAAALDPGDYMRVTIDGAEIYAANVAVATPGYVHVAIDVSAYANGLPRTLRFAAQTAGTGNIHIDDVMLDVTEGGDVPWLSPAPVSGTVATDSSAMVAVTFTAFPTMTLGTYEATLRVVTNDPRAGVGGVVSVPVSLVVRDRFELYLPLVMRR